MRRFAKRSAGRGRRRRDLPRPTLPLGIIIAIALIALTATRLPPWGERAPRPGPPAEWGPAAGTTRAGKVVSVRDGDTVLLESGDMVRYLGIDTPEVDEPFSTESRAANRSLVEGKTVLLELDEEPTDGYGRILAYVFTQGEGGPPTFVNGRLVEEGLARVYSIPPNLKRRGELVALQRRAIRNHRGVWSLAVEEEPYYIGSSYRLHRQSCKYVKSIRRPLRIESREDAFLRGLSPCRHCRP